MNDINENEMFKQLLSEGRNTIPFPDFEDEVMQKIEEFEAMEDLIREGYRRGIAFSWVFFILGILLGVLLYSWIPRYDVEFLGIESVNFLLLFQIGFLIFVLLHFEKLMVMTRVKLFNR